MQTLTLSTLSRKSSQVRGSSGWARACLVSLVAMAMMLGGTSVVVAQDDDRITSIEEVVVTAEKRESTLQETPIAITTFDTEQLSELRALEPARALNAAPNVIVRKQIASNDNYAFGFRGVAAGETALAVDNPVAFYVDGVYLGRLTGAAFDIGDIERLEVLRGPQGTLYGRNATGGAINIILNKPGEGFSFTQKAGYGSDGYWRSHTIFGSEEYEDGTSFRVSYVQDSIDGYLKNDADSGGAPGDLGGNEQEVFHLSVRTNPADNLVVDYSFENSRRESEPGVAELTGLNDYQALSIGALTTYDATGTVTGTQLPATFPIFDQAAGYASEDPIGRTSKYYAGSVFSDTDHHSLTVSWDIDDRTDFKSISSYRVWKSGVKSSVDPGIIGKGGQGTDFGSFKVQAGDVGDICHANLILSGEHTGCEVDDDQWVSLFKASRDSSQDQFTQEFQIVGESMEGNFRYVLGAFYFEEQADETNNQSNSYQGSAVPLVGGVSSALSYDHRIIQVLQDNIIATGALPATAAGILPFFAGRANLDTSAELIAAINALSGKVDLSNTASPTIAAIDTGTELEITDEEFLLGVLKGVLDATGAISGQTFRGLGNGALCGDADLSEGYVDLTSLLNINVLAEGGTAIPANSVTIAAACLGGLNPAVAADFDADLTNNSPLGRGKTVIGGSDVFDYGTDNSAVAIYGQGTYDFSDTLTLIVGLRYTWDKRSAYVQSSTLDGNSDGSFTGGREDRVESSEDWEKFNYDATLEYFFNANTTTYAKVATGYRAGGYNARAATRGMFEDPFDEENITSYELGVKTTLLDNHLRVNFAYFDMQYEDAQTSTFDPTLAGATSIIENAGEKDLSGFELELLWIPTPGLSVGFNYGYLDGSITYPNTVGNPNDGPNATLPYAPEDTWNLVLRYELPPLAIGKVTVQLDGGYQDGFTISATTPLDSPDPAAASASDRTVWNARVTISEIPMPGRDNSSLQVAFWGHNIGDEEYREFVIPFGTFGLAAWGREAYYGVDLKYSY